MVAITKHSMDTGRLRVMKTRQVFVSHTLDIDMFPADRSFAQAALDAISRAEMAAVDMRHFAAVDALPADYCRTRVRNCEIYIAIVGFRYGSIVPCKAISYTEMEFLEATYAAKPRLIFLLEESASPPQFSDADPTSVNAFRRRLTDAGLLLRYFTSSISLELEVFHALSQLPGTRQSLAHAVRYTEPLIRLVRHR